MAGVRPRAALSIALQIKLRQCRRRASELD
jgi:hypothetical protein